MMHKGIMVKIGEHVLDALGNKQRFIPDSTYLVRCQVVWFCTRGVVVINGCYVLS